MKFFSLLPRKLQKVSFGQSEMFNLNKHIRKLFFKEFTKKYYLIIHNVNDSGFNFAIYNNLLAYNIYDNIGKVKFKISNKIEKLIGETDDSEPYLVDISKNGLFCIEEQYNRYIYTIYNPKNRFKEYYQINSEKRIESGKFFNDKFYYLYRDRYTEGYKLFEYYYINSKIKEIINFDYKIFNINMYITNNTLKVLLLKDSTINYKYEIVEIDIQSFKEKVIVIIPKYILHIVNKNKLLLINNDLYYFSQRSIFKIKDDELKLFYKTNFGASKLDIINNNLHFFVSNAPSKSIEKILLK